MELPKRWMLNLALIGTAFGLSVSCAAADQICKGSFVLPAEAYWGGTLLQPGEYNFTVESDSFRTAIVYLKGEGMRKAILAGAMRSGPLSSDNHLTLMNVNGTYAVQSLNTGTLGKSYAFIIPKSVRAKEAATLINIPVSSGSDY